MLDTEVRILKNPVRVVICIATVCPKVNSLMTLAFSHYVLKA